MEHNSGRLLMFDKNKNLLWEYINRSKINNKLYRTNGSRLININQKNLRKTQENNFCEVK